MSVVFPQPEGALITMKSGFRVDFGVSMVQSLTRTDGVLSRPPRRFILSNKRREFYQNSPSPATATPILIPAPKSGMCRAGHCAVACFWDPSLHSPRPCRRTVWRGSFAPPCGHFASLVRSIASQSARVSSETLRVSTAHLAYLKTGKPPPLPALRVLPQTNLREERRLERRKDVRREE